PLPGCMIEKDEGGDLLHIGISTECSKMPPPRATAKEKQSRINDHWDARAFMSLSPPLQELAAGATLLGLRAPGEGEPAALLFSQGKGRFATRSRPDCSANQRATKGTPRSACTNVNAMSPV